MAAKNVVKADPGRRSRAAVDMQEPTIDNLETLLAELAFPF